MAAMVMMMVMMRMGGAHFFHQQLHAPRKSSLDWM